MTNESGSLANQKSGVTIMGISVPVYLILFAVISTGVWLDKIPRNFLTGFAFALVWGGLLTWIGVQNKYFDMMGGPSLLCMFVPTLLYFWGILPENFNTLARAFYTDMGYIEFFIAALITGSILSMDRNLLIKAGVRYAIPLVIGLILAMLATGAVGAVSGYGFKESMRDIALPIMGGGIGAGAIPISQMYNVYSGGGDTLSALLPAVTLGNLWAILFAAVLSVLGIKKDRFFKNFSGSGSLMQEGGSEFDAKEEKDSKTGNFADMGLGLVMAGTLYIFGHLIQKLLVPVVHAYAWTILTAAVLKITGIVPARLEKGAKEWYGLMSTIGVSTILILTSFCVIELPVIIESISNPAYLIMTLVCAAVAAIGAGFGGLLVKMNFVESGITAGLCMANMGGSGDVAVLGASKRMNLMPFAQISSRLGGALVLLITSFLAPWLMS